MGRWDIFNTYSSIGFITTSRGLYVGSLVAMLGVVAVYLADVRPGKQTGFSAASTEPAAEPVP
jgi:hypothetical protein